MTSAERIFATVAGQPVDRRAVVLVLSLYGAKLTNCPLDRYYTDAAAYARGQQAVRETFEPDAMFAPFNFPAIGAAFGSELRFFANQAPNLRRPAISSAADWPRVMVPDPDTHPCLLYFREAVQRMVADLRGEAPLVVPLPGLIDLPALILGMEGWLETVMFDPDAARRILDALAPFFVRWVNGLLAEGPVIAALPCAFATPLILPRETVATLMRPALAGVMAQLRGPVILHHGGTPMLDHLDLLTGLPPTVGFVMDPKDDLARSRVILGPESVLFNGPMAPQMPEFSAAQVEALCLQMLENRRHDPRFILCNTGPDVTWHTPPENIHAIRKAAVSFGGFSA